MGLSDFSLPAAGVVTTPCTQVCGSRDTASGPAFGQVLEQQIEQPDQPTPPVPASQNSAVPSTAMATADLPTDWLTLLAGIQAQTSARTEVPASPSSPMNPAPTGVHPTATQNSAPPAETGSTDLLANVQAMLAMTQTPVKDRMEVPATQAPLGTQPTNPLPTPLPRANKVDAAAEESDEQPAEAQPAEPAADKVAANWPVPSLAQFQVTPLPAPQLAAPLEQARPEQTALSLDTGNARTRQAPLQQPDAGELGSSAARALADAALGEPAAATPRQAHAAKAGNEDSGTAVVLAQPMPPGTASQASLPAATTAAAATPAERHLATPFGQRGWDQAVSQQVSWLVRDQLQNASISLNPPHLGPIQVTLQLDQQQATVQFVSAAPEVRQALQEALPVLREMLGQSGIELGRADVGSRQSERGDPGFQRQARRSRTADEEVTEASALPRTSGGGNGLVNLFA